MFGCGRGAGLKRTLNGLRLERPLESDGLVREQPASQSGTCRGGGQGSESLGVMINDLLANR